MRLIENYIESVEADLASKIIVELKNLQGLHMHEFTHNRESFTHTNICVSYQKYRTNYAYLTSPDTIGVQYFKKHEYVGTIYVPIPPHLKVTATTYRQELITGTTAVWNELSKFEEAS